MVVVKVKKKTSVKVKIVPKNNLNIEFLEEEFKKLTDELTEFRLKKNIKTSVWCKYFQHIKDVYVCKFVCPEKCSMFRSFRFVCKFPKCSEFESCVSKKYWCEDGKLKRKLVKEYLMMRKEWMTKRDYLNKKSGKRKRSTKIPFFSES